MDVEVDDKDLKAAGAEILTDGRHGLRIHGWEIVSCNGAILNSSSLITYSPSLSKLVSNLHSIEVSHANLSTNGYF
jgi:type 2A phosphatase activator TIP41